MNWDSQLSIFERGRRAYQEADVLVPDRWYEAVYVPYIIPIPLMYVLFTLTLSRYYFSPPIWLSVIGVLCSVVGWWFDTITTHRSMALRPEFERRHVQFPSYEMNPLTRETPHLLLQILSPSTLLFLLALLATWFFLPAMGITDGIAHAVAGLGNHRNTQRMRLNLKIYDDLSKREGELKGNGRETHSSEMLAGPFGLIYLNPVW